MRLHLVERKLLSSFLSKLAYYYISIVESMPKFRHIWQKWEFRGNVFMESFARKPPSLKHRPFNEVLVKSNQNSYSRKKLFSK